MRGQNKILHEHKGEGEDQDDGPEELNVRGCFWNKKKHLAGSLIKVSDQGRIFTF